MGKVTKYYRHCDPRRGFRLQQQLQIASEQRLLFNSQIQKINNMYRECADRHSKTFVNQPNENEALQNIVILLIFPMIVCYLLDNFRILAYLYAASFVVVIYFVLVYMDRVNRCRSKFEQANSILRQQFGQLQRGFTQRWPNYYLALMREWNEVTEACIEYIEISTKQQGQYGYQQIQQEKENVEPWEYGEFQGQKTATRGKTQSLQFQQ